jgi:GAF domain-containing protein
VGVNHRPDIATVHYEAKKRNKALILIRWFASLCLLLASISVIVFKLNFSWIALLSLTAAVSFYNGVFMYLCGKFQNYQRIYLHQIIFDWIALFFVCWYTGGITSPAVYLFPIYSSLAGFETNNRSRIMLAILSSLLVGLLGFLSLYGTNPTFHQILFVIGQIVFVILVNTVMSIIGRYASDEMNKRLKIVSDLRDSLSVENRRLQAVYDLTLEMNSTLDTSNVLSAIAKTVTRITPIVVGVVRLLSDDGKTITIMNVAGLKSEPNMGSVSLDRDLIDHEAITNLVPVYVPEVLDDPRFLYKDEASRESLVSLLAVPMIHYGKPLGVLRCYTNKIYDFSSDEIEFLKLVASESSLSIINAVNYKKILELDKSRSSFIRFATHELRAPMAAVQSILQLVLDGYTGDINPQQKKLFERANSRIEQLLKLVRELLELEGTSKLNFDFEPVNLWELLVQTINELAPKADAKHIKLKLGILKNPIDISCNHDSIHRVFENLIDNAIKYTPTGGRVDVNVSDSESNVTVSVSDTGIGIPIDQIPKLFSEFFRATNAKGSQVDGTGLGLSIVKKIIDNHNGQITVSSVENIGTTFTVVLPKMHDV